MRIRKRYPAINTAIFYCGHRNLNLIDLTFLNLKFCKINSIGLRNYIKSISDNNSFVDNFEPYKEIISNTHSIHVDYAYVLMPINKRRHVDHKIFYNLETIFLLMFPSDFRLYQICGHQHYRVNHYMGVSRFIFNLHFYPFTDFPELINIRKQEIPAINKFIKIALNKIETLDFMDVVISNYRDSFLLPPNNAYLSLMISLESIFNQAENEISHQISRGCSVLLSNRIIEGTVVYKNFKILYGIRSRIVHTGKEDESIKAIFKPFRHLASRVIIEILLHNIEKKEKLIQRIIELGYGMKSQVTKGYKKLKFNSYGQKVIFKKIIKENKRYQVQE